MFWIDKSAQKNYAGTQNSPKKEDFKPQNQKVAPSKDEPIDENKTKPMNFRKFKPRSNENFSHICTRARCDECLKWTKSKYLLFTNATLTSIHLPNNKEIKIKSVNTARNSNKSKLEDLIFDLKVPYEQVYSLHIYSLSIFKYFVSIKFSKILYSLRIVRTHFMYQD